MLIDLDYIVNPEGIEVKIDDQNHNECNEFE
jgi:hypothetical protein